MKKNLAICAAVLIAVSSASSYATTCTVPNNLANGQIADASQVMGNFNAVASCVDNVANAAVTTSGTVSAGGLATFTTPSKISSAVLSGDVTTPSGSLVATLAPSGVTPGTYGNATITVDGKGRVTSAVSGTGGGGLSQNYNHFNGLNLPVPAVANFTMTVDPNFGTNYGLQPAAMGVSVFGRNSNFSFVWADEAIPGGGKSGDFAVTGLIKSAYLNNAGDYAAGITLGDGTHRITWGYRNTQLWMSHTNGTTSSDGDSISVYGGDSGAFSSPTLFRIRKTGSTMYFEIALDGMNFDIIFSEPANAYLSSTVTTYGIGILPNNTFQRMVCYGLSGQ